MASINTTDALKLCKEDGVSITLVTLITWCQPFPKGYHIGKKVAGRWKVDRSKLKLILDGKQWILKERENERKKQLLEKIQAKADKQSRR